MPNGDVINDRLEFKKRIKDLPESERTIEVAMMVYDMKVEIENHAGNGLSKKQTAGISATVSVIISVISGVINYFKNGA